jgi:outer membrane protein
MIMKKAILWIAALLLAIGGAAAPGPAQSKLGVVNSQEVLEKSAEGKRVIARLEDTGKQNQSALVKLDEEIRALQTKLSTQNMTLTQEAAALISAELERKTTERKRKGEDFYAGFNALRDHLFGKLQEELLAVIAQIGKEKGFDLIFDLIKSGAGYWNPQIDLTAEVIKRYDASKAAAKQP